MGWHALYTRSRHEMQVHQRLADKGFESFLPLHRKLSARVDRRRWILTPLFPGYLFVRCQMIKEEYIEIMKVAGVVKILGSGFPNLSIIPEREIESLIRVVNHDINVQPYPGIKVGEAVRIISGPLIGMVGTLLDKKSNKSRFLISVHILNRSAVVEVDSDTVQPLALPTVTPPEGIAA